MGGGGEDFIILKDDLCHAFCKVERNLFFISGGWQTSSIIKFHIILRHKLQRTNVENELRPLYSESQVVELNFPRKTQIVSHWNDDMRFHFMEEEEEPVEGLVIAGRVGKSELRKD